MSESESYDSDEHKQLQSKSILETNKTLKVENDEKVAQDCAAIKKHHNMLEKKRRNTIKDSFSQLRDVLPVFEKKERVRASRIQILKEAIHFIRTGKSPQEMSEEIASIAEENRRLKELFAELDYANQTKNVEAIDKLKSRKPPFKRRLYLLEHEDTDSEDGESSDEDGGGSPPPVAAPLHRLSKRMRH